MTEPVRRRRFDLFDGLLVALVTTLLVLGWISERAWVEVVAVMVTLRGGVWLGKRYGAVAAVVEQLRGAPSEPPGPPSQPGGTGGPGAASPPSSGPPSGGGGAAPSARVALPPTSVVRAVAAVFRVPPATGAAAVAAFVTVLVLAGC